MRLVQVKIFNFRGYSEETSIDLDPLTILIGRNDAGKSTVLDALDAFFNDTPLEQGDCCVHTETTEVRVTCVFDELPAELVLDEQHPTTLASEYMLRADGKLELVKKYNCSAAKVKAASICAVASHPSAAGVNDLLGLKLPELRARAQQRQVNLAQANQAVKADIRRAIWQQAGDLALQEQHIPLTKETAQEIWDKLQPHLPVYALFKSDRASTDQDDEAQDPLRSAIKEAIRRRETDLSNIVEEIRQELGRVADRTVEKIREMSPTLAAQLQPTVRNKGWDTLFSVSLTGESDIPLNKRGSGTRRLVLINFFRARAEDESTGRQAGVIYAMEEPETSQHPDQQMMLLEAFEDLVEQRGCQVLLTTHNPSLARRVDRSRLRLIEKQNGVPLVESGSAEGTLEKIRTSLGVLPDHNVRVFLGVEGKNDIYFLKRISSILAATENDIPDLSSAEQDGKLVFIPLGGSSMELWVSRLAEFNRPEFYITDRDTIPPAPPKYQNQIDQWTARGCTAWVTSKRELENYLHPDAIRPDCAGYAGTGEEFENVPLLFAQETHSAIPNATPWAQLSEKKRDEKESRAKRRLNTTCVARMTPQLLTAIDANDEIRTWLRSLGEQLGD